jgi:hypothetical protein
VTPGTASPQKRLPPPDRLGACCPHVKQEAVTVTGRPSRITRHCFCDERLGVPLVAYGIATLIGLHRAPLLLFSSVLGSLVVVTPSLPVSHRPSPIRGSTPQGSQGGKKKSNGPAKAKPQPKPKPNAQQRWNGGPTTRRLPPPSHSASLRCCAGTLRRRPTCIEPSLSLTHCLSHAGRSESHGPESAPVSRRVLLLLATPLSSGRAVSTCALEGCVVLLR